jgi:hypothetical protein
MITGERPSCTGSCQAHGLRELAFRFIEPLLVPGIERTLLGWLEECEAR